MTQSFSSPNNDRLVIDAGGVQLGNRPGGTPLELPFASIIDVRLGLNSHQLVIEHLTHRYDHDTVEFALPSAAEANAAFVAIRTSLGDGFEMELHERDVSQPVRWLLGVACATVFLFGFSFGIEQTDPAQANPLRVLLALGFTTLVMYRLQQGNNLEVRGLLTVLTGLSLALLVGACVPSELVLMAGMAGVVACFVWVIERLVSAEAEVSLHRLPVLLLAHNEVVEDADCVVSESEA
jgi:hypothetical protein